jgi:hypothetical protein
MRGGRYGFNECFCWRRMKTLLRKGWTKKGDREGKRKGRRESNLKKRKQGED